MKTVWIFIFLAMILKLNADHVKSCSTYYCEIDGASSDFTISTKNNQVLEVKFFNSGLENFPNQLIDSYPELRKCGLSESKVQHLDIKKATKLEWLDASRNQISELSVASIKNIRGIVSLYFSRNRITNLTTNIFADLPKLEVLDLSHNQISILDVNNFVYLKLLKFLYLNHNNLTELTIKVSLAPNLIEIDGGHNQINKSSITLPSVYKGLLNLEYNQYSKYTITDVGESKIDGNTIAILIIKGKSSKVSANYNKIISIEITLKTELEVLLLRGNLLKDIRNITETVSIQVLDISLNPIESIEENAFFKMIHLRHLSLRDTGLLIPRTFLPAQRKLISLDISDNSIESLDMRSFKYLINLQTLKIENCSLAKIENYADQKEILPALKTISIDRNELSCSSVVEFINLCSENEIQIMSGPFSVDVNSPNILGISCNGIEELHDKLKEEHQWHGTQQTMMIRELNEKLKNCTTETEMHLNTLDEKSATVEIFYIIITIFAAFMVTTTLFSVFYCYRRSRRHQFVDPKSAIDIEDDSKRSFFGI